MIYEAAFLTLLKGFISVLGTFLVEFFKVRSLKIKKYTNFPFGKTVYVFGSNCGGNYTAGMRNYKLQREGNFAVVLLQNSPAGVNPDDLGTIHSPPNLYDLIIDNRSWFFGVIDNAGEDKFRLRWLG